MRSPRRQPTAHPVRRKFILIILMLVILASGAVVWHTMSNQPYTHISSGPTRATLTFTGPYGGGVCVYRAKVGSTQYCVDDSSPVQSSLTQNALATGGIYLVDADVHYGEKLFYSGPAPNNLWEQIFAQSSRQHTVFIDKVYSVTASDN